MNINISQQTNDYLKKKNINCLTLNMVIAGSGDLSGCAIPQVNYEEPSDKNRYYHTLVNNINVFIHKSAIEDDIKLEFVLRKFLFYTYVDVEGIKIL
ncbi:MAG: hypothetical protein GYA50_04970 [Eubacteriaceae bacterium]|nr:hypothetical protein [Eubacteriaceae bacterium]